MTKKQPENWIDNAWTRRTSDDVHPESRRAGRWLMAFCIYLVSFYLSYQELKYAFRGESAIATIVSVRITTTPGSRTSPPRDVLAVRYAWHQKNGLRREDVINRAINWQAPEDGRLSIDYLPDEKGSRAAGERNTVALTVFGIMTAAAFFVIVRVMVQAYKKQPSRHSAGRRDPLHGG